MHRIIFFICAVVIGAQCMSKEDWIELPEEVLQRKMSSFFWWYDYLNREDGRMNFQLKNNNFTNLDYIKEPVRLAFEVFCDEMEDFENTYHVVRKRNFEPGENATCSGNGKSGTNTAIPE